MPSDLATPKLLLAVAGNCKKERGGFCYVDKNKLNNITPWKFNIAPENIPSQKESSLPTIISQGRAVKLREGIPSFIVPFGIEDKFGYFNCLPAAHDTHRKKNTQRWTILLESSNTFQWISALLMEEYWITAYYMNSYLKCLFCYINWLARFLPSTRCLS